jgi:hypothetical protein
MNLPVVISAPDQIAVDPRAHKCSHLEHFVGAGSKPRARLQNALNVINNELIVIW